MFYWFELGMWIDIFGEWVFLFLDSVRGRDFTLVFVWRRLCYFFLGILF